MVIFLVVVLVLVLLYLLLICPALRSHPESKLCQKLYVAHRGLHDIEMGIPENSITSYKRALEHGFAIEIDIHLTKDGRVAVFHDDTLTRVCGIDRRIEDMTSQELSECKLLGTNERIPMLEEVLDTIDGKECLVIEFKCTPGNYKKLCIAADKLLQNYNGKYIVQSFNPLAMGWYRFHRPDICRGQLATNFIYEPDNDVLRTLVGFLLLNVISRPDFVSYGIKHTNVISRKICSVFGAISAGWTFKMQSELEKYHSTYDIYIFEGFIPKKESCHN